MQLTHDNTIEAALEFTNAYLICALWCEADVDGEPLQYNYSLADISAQTLVQATKDCTEFLTNNPNSFNDTPDDYTIEQAGGDFWLTRNGHGAGYWDRGLDDSGESLTQACEDYRALYIVVGDDGKIYFE